MSRHVARCCCCGCYVGVESLVNVQLDAEGQIERIERYCKECIGSNRIAQTESADVLRRKTEAL